MLSHTNINSHDKRYLMIIKGREQKKTTKKQKRGCFYIDKDIHVRPQNKLVSVRIPSHVFLCISRFHRQSKKRKTSCHWETESHIERSSVLQNGDILNSFISVSGSASTVASMWWGMERSPPSLLACLASQALSGKIFLVIEPEIK